MKERPTQQQCWRCAHRVAVLVVAGSLFLGVLKVSLGIFAQSASVTADGVESFVVGLGAILVMLGLKFGQKPADSKFPYGYGKIELLVSVVLYAGLFGLGLFLAIGSGLLLIDERFSGPKLIALPVAAVSVIGTYLMYSLCRCAAKSTGSAGLMADAQQNLADTLTSAAVLISVALAQLGPSFYWCDSLGAGIVGLMIMKDAARFWWSDIRVLVDTALPQDRILQIRAAVATVEGIMWTSFVKARRTGQRVRVDLGVLVSPEGSVSEAQQMSTDARAAVLRRLSWVEDVDVYVYPAEKIYSRSTKDVAGAWQPAQSCWGNSKLEIRNSKSETNSNDPKEENPKQSGGVA